MRRQLSIKRSSVLGSLQENRFLSLDEEPTSSDISTSSIIDGDPPLSDISLRSTQSLQAPKVFTAEDYFHKLRDKNRKIGTLRIRDRNNHLDPKTKRVTDTPIVVKKVKSSVEHSPPNRSSLTALFSKTQENSMTKVPSDKSEQGKSKPKSSFLAGLTKLFKKRVIVSKPEDPVKPNSEIEEVYIMDGRIRSQEVSDPEAFEMHTPPAPRSKPMLISEGECMPSIPTEDNKDHENVVENTILSEKSENSPDPSVNSSPPRLEESEKEGSGNVEIDPEAPLWVIFSNGPVSPVFEGTNIISSEPINIPKTLDSPLTTAQTQEKLSFQDSEITGTNSENPPELTGEHSSEEAIIGAIRNDGDSDEKTIEVWECYQDPDLDQKERKVTWLFSDGSHPSHFEMNREEEVETETEKSHLPRLFGNLVNIAPNPAKKDYAKYYMKPVEITKSSALKKAKSLPKSPKHVTYCSLEIRFYNYTIGQGIPSDQGPSLGLNWEFDSSLSLHFDLEVFEEFRGGIVPDDVDDDEEWNDNWRIPRFSHILFPT
jgi:hypothetical protein